MEFQCIAQYIVYISGGVTQNSNPKINPENKPKKTPKISLK